MKTRRLWIKTVFLISIALSLAGSWVLISSGQMLSPIAMAMSGSPDTTLQTTSLHTAYLPNVMKGYLSPGVISGKVTESDGVTPIAGAEVAAAKTKDGYSSTTTAADGTYAIGNLAPGFYEVRVTAFGFVPVSRPGIPAIVGQTTTDVDFALLPGLGSISGRVTEGDGIIPVGGVEVYAIGETTGSLAISNEDGTYLILDLDPGAYEVIVSQGEYLPQSWPDIGVVAGKTTTDVNFALTKAGSISGTVHEGDGATPVAEADVFALGEKGGLGSATTGGDGAYAITGLAPDTYKVSVTAIGFAESLRSDVSVAADQSVTDIDFVLGQFGSISGTVTEADGMTPIGGVEIHASEPGGAYGATMTDADGTYILEGLPVGSYEVEAAKEGLSFAPRENIEVQGGVRSNVDLSAHGGAISGKVTKGDDTTPIAGATVSVTASRVEGPTTLQRLSASTTTASDGTYRIDSLQAGAYIVQASAPGSGTIIQTATVTDLETPNVDFVLGAYGSIAGQVVRGDDETLIGGAEIIVSDADDNPIEVGDAGITNESGEYVIDSLSPGTYYVQVRAYGFEPTPRSEVSVLAGEGTENVNFSLVLAEGSISGTVYESDHVTPVANALVLAMSPLSNKSTLTSADGTYIIDSLASGNYFVAATAPGSQREIKEGIVVEAGHCTSDIDFHLQAE